MRWMLLTLVLVCLAFGCEKEIHEAKTPLQAPVASANPATAPVGSAVATALDAKTVPDVPSEITTSPGRRPSANAAAMLSPVPVASDRKSVV